MGQQVDNDTMRVVDCVGDIVISMTFVFNYMYRLYYATLGL